MDLKRYYAKARAMSDPRILYRVLRGIFRALVLRKNTLRSIHILPTFDCQARCKMCSVAKFRKDNRDVLTLADYESIADQGARMGALAVTFLGGEPLLADNIEDLIRIFKARHFFVSMASNGIAVTRDFVRRLRSAGLDSIYLSLESLDERVNDELRGFKGQYRKVMGAISICKEEGLQVGLCTVFFPGEMQRYVELAEYCEKNDLSAYLSTVAAVGAAEGLQPASEEQYEQAMELSKRYRRLAVDCVGWSFSYSLRPRCPAGKEKIEITCYGDVMGCSLNHISFGNVTQEPLERIWRRAGRFSQFRKNSDRCLAAYDSYHIENYLAPIARFDKSPVHYEDHPNITRETEPGLFSAGARSTRRPATDDGSGGRGPGGSKAMGRLWQRFASLVVRLVQKHGPHTVEVMGRTYVVSKDVFNPKFYITSEFMAKHISVTPEDEVLDIGTGSGIQAITAGQVARKVVAIDINPQAVRCARENVRRNGLEGTVSVLQGDLFSPLPPGALFDVILLTPPYFEGRVRTDFDHALYDPRKSLAKRFLTEARNYLRPNGYIQMVYSTRAEPERVMSIARELGWHSSVIAERKGLIETFLLWKLTPKNAD